MSRYMRILRVPCIADDIMVRVTETYHLNIRASKLSIGVDVVNGGHGVAHTVELQARDVSDQLVNVVYITGSLDQPRESY